MSSIDEAMRAAAIGAIGRVVPSPSRPLEHRVDALGAAEWDRSAVLFDDVSYDQTAAYSDRRWKKSRVGSIALVRDGTLLGMARLVQLKVGPLPGGVAYVKFGPLWRRTRLSADPSAYRAIVEAVVEEYCRRRGYLLTIMPRPDPDFAAAEAAILSDFGFQVRRPMLDPIGYFVNLSLDADAQLASLGQKWRYHLRKALASDVSVAIESGPAAIEVFRTLHGQMLSRKRFYSVEAVHLLDELAQPGAHSLRPSFVLARR